MNETESMDIQLKERLVGAMVLVLAAVIFIPMLLDGPNRNRQVSQAVPLPAENGSERRTVRISLDPATPVSDATLRQRQTQEHQAAEPASVDLTESQQTADAAQPEVAVRAPAQAVPPNDEPAAKPARSVPAAKTQTAAEAAWTVQVGSFSSSDNAEGLAGKLKQQGHAAFVSEFRDAKGMHYRVRVGGFADRDAAQVKADQLRKSTGEPARPVPVD